MPIDNFETMFIIKSWHIHRESTIFLKAIEELGFLFCCLKVGYFILKFIQDFLYQYVARNHYNLFDKID